MSWFSTDGNGWLVVLRIYIALAVLLPYRDFEAGENKFLKFKRWGGELNPGPLAPQAKSLTTWPPLLLVMRLRALTRYVIRGAHRLLGRECSSR